MYIIENAAILAFDILPMSSTERREGVRVAASAKFSDGKTKEWSELSRDKLLRIVEKYDIQYLGTDNPAEIVASNETIGAFCDQLPASCSLVHVNLTRGGSTVSLQSLIHQYQVNNSNRKLSAVKTARAIVELIQQGVGMVLEPYENETLIKVGKPSSSSKGGWSQARYQRQNEEVVAREANKIKDLLDRKKLPYDEIIHSTKYGAKMARFHVFNSRYTVDDALASHSFYPANVKIWSPKKNLVSHRPLSTRKDIMPTKISSQLRRLIIGLDPGMTTGVAIMNLSGKILSVFSRKNLSKGQLVAEIANFGVPILVCADVSPVPTFVSKFAATYNADIYAPDIELSKEDKRFLSNQYQTSQRLDSHQRDAIAAVKHAYRKLEDNLQKIDNVEEFGRKERDIAKGLLIRGLSVKDSISAVQLLQERETSIEGVEEEKDYHKQDLELIGRVSNLLQEMASSETIISNLRAHAGRIESQNILLHSEISRLQKQIMKIQQANTRETLREDIVLEKDRKIRQLEKRLEDHQDNLQKSEERINDLEEMLWISVEKGGLPVKILDKFSHDAINRLRQKHGIENGDIILILDPTGGGPQTAENLAENDLEFIFVENYDLADQAFEVFYREEIPVRRSEKYSILRSNYLGIINQHNLLQAKEDYQEYVNKRRNREKTEKIFQTIENYQYERSKELQDKVKSYEDYEIDEDELTSD